MIYTTASDTYAVADLTAAGRALLDDADAAAQLVTLGAQPLDADLTQIAGLTRSRGKLIVGGASAWTDLALGAAGTQLVSDGTDVVWDTGGLFFRLNSAHAGANVTTAQNVFPLSVTLEASTAYEYQLVYSVSRTAGTTGHDFSTLFGGTATLNNIYRDMSMQGINTAATTAASVSYFGYRLSAAAVIVVAGLGTATSNVWVTERGTVSINGAGTFIPKYQLSAAPGGAYSTNAGGFFTLRKLGAAGANNSQGPWA